MEKPHDNQRCNILFLHYPRDYRASSSNVAVMYDIYKTNYLDDLQQREGIFSSVDLYLKWI